MREEALELIEKNLRIIEKELKVQSTTGIAIIRQKLWFMFLMMILLQC